MNCMKLVAIYAQCNMNIYCTTAVVKFYARIHTYLKNAEYLYCKTVTTNKDSIKLCEICILIKN